MTKKKVTFRHRAEYVLFVAFVMLIKVSPLFLLRFNGKILRFAFDRIGKRYHRVVEKNLAIAFPNLDPEETRRLKDRIYRHYSNIMVEDIYLFVKQKPPKTSRRIEVKNLRVLEEALKKERGVIIFSAHFGNWELVPYILSRELDTTVNSIARKMNNPLVENKVKKFREYMGSSVIYKKNAVRSMINRFNANGIVFLLVDQHTIPQEGVKVTFFDREVIAVPTVAQLHIRKGIPAIPVFLHYEEDKIVLELLEEVDSPGSGDRGADVQQLTQQCLAAIEEKVRQYPEQWFWFHDRWKWKQKKTKETKTKT